MSPSAEFIGNEPQLPSDPLVVFVFLPHAAVVFAAGASGLRAALYPEEYPQGSRSEHGRPAQADFPSQPLDQVAELPPDGQLQ